MAEVSPDNFGFLGGLLDAVKTGAQHTYGQLRDDFGSLLGGEYNPGTLGRIADIAQELPLGRTVKSMGGLEAILAGVAPRRMGGKVFREAAEGAAPMVRESGGKVFKAGPQQFAELAKAGVRPVTESHKMWPALIDERTGQVIHSMKPGAYQHDSLYGALPKNFQPTRGFVDPLTFQAFTEKMLEGQRQF